MRGMASKRFRRGDDGPAVARLWPWITTILLVNVANLGVAEVMREFEISEGVPVGTTIGFIGEGTTGSGRAAPPPPYLIVPVPGSYVDSDLIIDEGSGEIKTRVKLDRETRDSYSLVAIPMTGENIRVVITVQDENDNAPTFPSDFMSVEFPENTPRDVKRTLLPAKDRDLGIFNTQRYVIKSGNVNNAFRLSSHRERDGVLYLDLQVNGFLDRETTPFYNMVIDAFDGGVPPLKGSIRVNVIIQDVNDSGPRFTGVKEFATGIIQPFNQSRYFATVAENTTVGTPIIQVFAEDTDAGANGDIKYSINRRKTDKESVFRIDEKSGVVYVNRPLDFESREVHELVVVARDRGVQPLESTVFILITIIDVNDNQPAISLIFLTDDATPKVSESSPPGDFVARISVHDPDSKMEVSNVNVSLEGGQNDFGLATRNNAVYLVVTAKDLDREKKSNYSLVVSARDAGSPPLNTSTDITLMITDENDNPPVFEQAEYQVSVIEIADPDSSVLQVVAHDPDIGNNSIVSYQLVEDSYHHSQWFNIDPNTGLITTRMNIDCETDPRPELTIIARDHGNPSLSSSAKVYVNIRDLNDNEPIFDHSFYNVSVNENTPVGKCILKVSASDPDCGINSMVNYTIRESSGKQTVPFIVNPVTGELCTDGSLDYEQRDLYELPVVASDTGGLSSVTVVKIQVLDLNDNYPRFYPLRYNVSVKEGVKPHTPIVAVAATDKDSGKHGKIIYTIVSGNDYGFFHLNRHTGEIILTQGLSRRRKTLHQLSISATDGSGLSSERNAQVTISVIDSKQMPPVFSKARYSFSVDEDVPVRYVVGPVSATSGGSRRVRYSISSGDPHSYFTIDEHTGVISAANKLDHERHPSILLNIEATTDDPPAYSHCQVDIDILDVNDNVAQFETQEVSIWVPENAEIGAVIYQAHAVDADEKENGRVSYNLLQSHVDLFSLDEETGRVLLRRGLDYEIVQKYSVVIGTMDHGSPRREGQNLTLHIEVQDINDCAPKFDQSKYIVSLPESLPVNSQILEVHATDDDTGNNARITYALHDSQFDGLIGVFPSTGILYLKSSLDREAADSFLIQISANDHGSPVLSSVTTVSLHISDENDNPPAFPEKMYRFWIEENNENDATIGRVTAYDRDIGENGAIRYSLQPSNSKFHIDPISGVIRATEKLDREEKSQYELQVVAYDLGTPQLQSEALMHIIIKDNNDHSPEILEPNDINLIAIREGQPKGTVVTRIVANDPDNGDNGTVIFSLVHGHSGDGRNFKIHAQTGVLRTKVVLDYNQKQFYTLKIRARDQGSPSLETIHQVRIEVLRKSDNRPTFSHSKFTFQVGEDAEVGDIVGSILPSDHVEHVSYIIESGNENHSFEIEKYAGVLVVANKLDYESKHEYSLGVKCLYDETMNYQVNVITIEIEVLDVNDNRPKFADDPITIRVSEGTPAGSSLWNLSAVDVDDGLNGISHYHIVGEEKIFRVNALTGTLYLQKGLDYETNKSHLVVVCATDQAKNESLRLNSTVTAHVLVIDENDNSPVFQSPWKINLFEFEPVNSNVHTLIAIDKDDGENGEVRYAIVGGNYDGYFDVDSDTGKIILLKQLQRDHVDSFTLNVTATDMGSPTNSASQLLQIIVNAANNSPPQFAYRKYEARVEENAPIGTEVVRVDGITNNNHGNVSLKYVLPKGMGDGKFKVDPSIGSIILVGRLDREMQDHYELTVYVHDENYAALYDTTKVDVEVTDINDNGPDFVGSCTDILVPENRELGVFHTFTAVDPDEGRNRQVTFSITGGNVDNIFTLDIHSGKLTSRPLDRERRSEYNLVIAAEDQGLPKYRTLCNMTVRIIDQNDNSPVWRQPKENNYKVQYTTSLPKNSSLDVSFLQPLYSASIPENVDVGTTVLKVEARDADVGVNSMITYSLNNESHWHFTIDNATGAITVAGKLDREKIQDYMFEVAAMDGGLYDARSSAALVHLQVTDANDNRPKFKENPVIVEVPAHVKSGHKIIQVVGSDADEGINAQINYSLENGENRFRINPRNGHISSTRSLSKDSGKIFHLKVVAKDKGTPSLNSTALVVIEVGDVLPRSRLRFQKDVYATHLYENSIVGTPVVKVTALRSDGRRQIINYEIVGGNELEAFDIDSNGQITVRNGSVLDRETTLEFKLVISGSSIGNNGLLRGHTIVEITLKDENDNVPRFTQNSYIASVWEGNSKGTFVTQVTAIDIDEGSNSNIIYHIVDGNHDNAFVIEPPFSGIVKTNIVLDREIQDKYKLTLIATDEGSPQMTGTCMLNVNVIDIQDQSPVFPPHSVINISESVPVGTVITTVVANDVDTNPSLVYSFSEDGNPDEMFYIGKYSGRVTLAKPLDFERWASHEVQIQVSDSVHIAYTQLTVNVIDANDHSPIFDEEVYHLSLADSYATRKEILKVTARDVDSGRNGEVRYRLRATDNLDRKLLKNMWMEESTGNLYANGSFSGLSSSNNIQVIVTAEDLGNPPKNSNATIWFDIRPTKSEFVRFSKKEYFSEVREDIQPGFEIEQLDVVYDGNYDKNLHFHFSIVSGNEDELFTITSHSGKIITAKSINGIEKENCYLKIAIRCISLSKCSSEANVKIKIIPVFGLGERSLFSKKNHIVSVSEGTAIGSTLLELESLIDFKHKAKKLRYTVMSGLNPSVINLHPTMGTVVLNEPLDFEVVEQYSYVIKAEAVNSTEPTDWSLISIQLDVTDENDNAPLFPLSVYTGFIGENEPAGSDVFVASAFDKDQGRYGKLNYTILEGDGKDKFHVDRETGLISTVTVFDYEVKQLYYFILRANDVGGLFSTVKVEISIDSKDEFSPKYTEKQYKWICPLNAGAGYVVGHVEAIDQDRGADGQVFYQLRRPNNYFSVNHSNGAIVLEKPLDPDTNVSLAVVADSGKVGSKSALAMVEIGVGAPLKHLEVASSSHIADWVIGLLVTSLLLLLICCTIFIVLHLRHKKQNKNNGVGNGVKSETYDNSGLSVAPRFDTLDYAHQSTMLAGAGARTHPLYGRQYSDLTTDLDRRRVRNVNTGSEISDQSNSASSGRGSAEEGDEGEDEEIRMINEASLMQKKLRDSIGIPDSGIHGGDEDNVSGNSAKNTQEYLARLGIHPKHTNDELSQTQSQISSNSRGEWTPSADALDNMGMFDNQPPSDRDITALIYSQIPEEGMESRGGPHMGGNNGGSSAYHQPSMNGSLSSIVHSEEELTGSYNWDYLLNWGPQYQPLAHVFSEIARLKDDVSSVNGSENHYSGISSRHSVSNQSKGKGSIRSYATPTPNTPVSLPNSHQSMRQGPLPPLPLLARSPISHDSSITSGPLSPSFSPALSPLANRSPSICPLGGPTVGAPNPNIIRTAKYHQNYSGSESEMRI